ncbi:MAG: 30S ribosomal protein S9 [Candidatus Daviesbacteria bacterium]|nr:MAG: 30S ribosomal protein S9 [Candidatus Daviesbacteria bacterium]
MAEVKNKKNNNFWSAVGRRKEAVARVRLLKGQGNLSVNGKNINEYFSLVGTQAKYNQPFIVTNTPKQFDATIKIMGGGKMAQLEAAVHGLSRALLLADPKFRTPLKQAGLLTRDPRVKERRKYGLAQKARAKKQSPKR